jgi:hypothetical protein
MEPCPRKGSEMADIVRIVGDLPFFPAEFIGPSKGRSRKTAKIRHFPNLACPLQTTGHPADHRRIWKIWRHMMFAFTLSSVREALVSAAGAMVCSAVLVAAAVLPAQSASAALFHL